MIRKNLLLVAAVLSVVLVACDASSSTSPSPGSSNGSSASGGANLGLSADMDTEQVVTPSGKPWKAPADVRGATGSFTGTFDSDRRELTWEMTYEGLGDPILRIVDVHLGERGDFGAVLVRLCGPCEEEELGGVIKLERDSAEDLSTHPLWVALVTEHYANGVIRGQIRVA